VKGGEKRGREKGEKQEARGKTEKKGTEERRGQYHTGPTKSMTTGKLNRKIALFAAHCTVFILKTKKLDAGSLMINRGEERGERREREREVPPQ
jgi:hypothetical protein